MKRSKMVTVAPNLKPQHLFYHVSHLELLAIYLNLKISSHNTDEVQFSLSDGSHFYSVGGSRILHTKLLTMAPNSNTISSSSRRQSTVGTLFTYLFDESSATYLCFNEVLKSAIHKTIRYTSYTAYFVVSGIIT